MHTKNLLVTLTTLLLLASTTLDAKTPKEPCSSSVECDAMAEDLQGKINSVKAKGLENLTREEYISYLHLKKKLLAVSKVRTAQAKAKNTELKKIIARKDTEIAEEKEKQAALKSLSKKLDEIGALLK